MRRLGGGSQLLYKNNVGSVQVVAMAGEGNIREVGRTFWNDREYN